MVHEVDHISDRRDVRGYILCGRDYLEDERYDGGWGLLHSVKQCGGLFANVADEFDGLHKVGVSLDVAFLELLFDELFHFGDNLAFGAFSGHVG